ncbi:MAG: hypothetical protein U9P44_03510, partial [archaeon]|nr:hypothetical protein [archaeon]
GDKLVTMSFFQEDDRLIVSPDCGLSVSEEDFVKRRVSHCLGTMEDFSDFYAVCEKDKVLAGFMDKIYGNRLLSAFSDFEALVSIICSQNVSFAQYKAMVGKIVDAYGGGLVFPGPLDILRDVSLLKYCGVGYRSGFIENVAEFVGGRDSVDDAHRLSSVCGIGPYSIDIFILFQKRKYDFFYVDSLIKKIIRNDYGSDIVSEKDVRAFASCHWGRYAGLAEVYLQKFLYDN